jgi:F-type H+-transporting ATPase subunit b
MKKHIKAVLPVLVSLAWFALAQLALPALGLAQEHEAHGGGEHEGGHGGIDLTMLIASFVNFFVLISVFIYLFRDKVTASLKERRASIENELNEASRLKKEAEAKHKEYSDRLAKLDQELDQIKRDMIAAGTKERDRILAEAEEKASRMRKEAEFIIEQQVKQLRDELTHEASEAAVAAAEQLLVKATTSFDQQRLAQEYLAALQKNGGEEKPHAAASSQSESMA